MDFSPAEGGKVVMWSLDEALRYLEQTLASGMKAGHEPLRRLLALCGHPDRRLAFLHLAGTNGKGSTALTTASLLAAQGLKVGLFTSPHLLDVRERIRLLDGAEGLKQYGQKPSSANISPADFAVVLEEVAQLEAKASLCPVDLDFERAEQGAEQSAEEGTGPKPLSFQERGLNPANYRASSQPGQKASESPQRPLSFFEVLTLAAILYYAKQKVDVVVWETGLGGRLDATNLIERPAAVAITALHHDHAAFLGERMEEIAGEKAGIFKQGCKIFALDPESSLHLPKAEGLAAKAVLQKEAAAKSAPLYFLQNDQWEQKEADSTREWGLGWQLKSSPKGYQAAWTRHFLRTYESNLLGEHQLQNLSLAIWLAADFLLESQWMTAWRHQRSQPGQTFNKEAVAQSLASAFASTLKELKWPGRMECLSKQPLILLDGAHNLQGVRQFAKACQAYLSQRPRLMLSYLRGKSAKEMLAPMLEALDEHFPLKEGEQQLVYLHSVQAESERGLSLEDLAADVQSLSRFKEGKLQTVCLSSLETFFKQWEEEATQGSNPPPLLIFGSLYLGSLVQKAWQKRALNSPVPSLEERTKRRTET